MMSSDYRTIVRGERELAARLVLSMRTNADDLESLGLFDHARALRWLSDTVASETAVATDA